MPFARSRRRLWQKPDAPALPETVAPAGLAGLSRLTKPFFPWRRPAFARSLPWLVGGLCLSLTASTANAPVSERPLVLRREAEAALWQRREAWPARTLPGRRLPAPAPWFEPRPRRAAPAPASAPRRMMPPAGGEFEAPVWLQDDQAFPSVAMDDLGNVVVVWQSENQEFGFSGYGIYGQRFDAAGTPLGAEAFPVNTETTNDQSAPAVAMDAAGNFVVAWTSPHGPGVTPDIYARRFDAAGTAQDANEVRANVTTVGGQGDAAVAMDAAGNFVVAWTSSSGAGPDIFGRRFDAAGTPLDANEFRVNTETSGDQQRASVSMDAAGDFVVVWDSPDEDDEGVFGQRFSSGGAAQSGEFQANTYTSNAQSLPAVALDAAGNFVVAWQSVLQDGSGYGIFARNYQADGGPLPVELSSFTAVRDGEAVLLAWSTAGETNNAGFHVEARPDGPGSPWHPLAFVEGRGTTAEPRHYTYRAEGLAPGRHHFRLKQVDYDGAFTYSAEVEATVEVPAGFVLSAVYPNPFNPKAAFTLALRQGQRVRVEVVDAVGRRVAVLHDGRVEAGQVQRFELDGWAWASGTYLIRVTGETFTETRTVTLVK